MQKLIIILAILLLLPTLASSQSTSQATPEQSQSELDKRIEDRFLKAKSFKCIFKNGNFTTWGNGKLKSKATKDTLSLLFDSVDYKKGTARMVGNQGVSDVFVMATVGGVTFIETTTSGSVNTTTIFYPNTLDNSLINKFYSVHSRHIAPLTGGPMLSQYYGQAEIWDINR